LDETPNLRTSASSADKKSSSRAMSLTSLLSGAALGFAYGYAAHRGRF